MSPYAHITGNWGMAVPEKIMTNDEIAQRVDTTDEWIQSRTGIRERRIAAEGETSATLAIRAAEEALQVANLSPEDVELIIVSTSSPEHIFPADPLGSKLLKGHLTKPVDIIELSRFLAEVLRDTK